MSDSSRFNAHLALSAVSHLGLILLLIFAFRTLAGSSQGIESAEKEPPEEIPLEEAAPEDVTWLNPAEFSAAAEADVIPYAHWKVSTEDPASKIVLPATPEPASPPPLPEPEPEPLPEPEPAQAPEPEPEPKPAPEPEPVEEEKPAPQKIEKAPTPKPAPPTIVKPEPKPAPPIKKTVTKTRSVVRSAPPKKPSVTKAAPKPAPAPVAKAPTPKPRTVAKAAPKRTVVKSTTKPRTVSKPAPKPAPTPAKKVTPARTVASAKKSTPSPSKPSPTTTSSKKPGTTPSAKPVASSSSSTGTGGSRSSNSSGSSNSAARVVENFDWYDQIIQSAFHRHWRQPKGTFGNRSLSTRAAITIAPDGRIVSARVITPSGLADLDGSVNDALGAVRQIQRLPAGLAKKGNYSVTIRFTLN